MQEIVLKSKNSISNKKVKLYTIRNERVLLDYDLASLYEVEVKNLKRSVKRNIERFPEDFLFELNKEEFALIKTQNTEKTWREQSKYLPYAFTEQGVAMLSSVLSSKKAVKVNIEIMRAFVNVRKLLDQDLEFKDQVNKKLNEHDGKIQKLFDVIQKLIKEESTAKKKIGFYIAETN